MRHALGSISVTVGLLAACGGAETKEPSIPVSTAPFSADLAGRIQPDLLACDLGVVNACRELGGKLENANRLREAVSAYDYGCQLGATSKTAEAEKCHIYGPGQSCNKSTCEKCAGVGAQKRPECRKADPVICAERERFCRYETLEGCVDLVSAHQCVRAAYVYYEQMPAAAGKADGCGSPEWLARASAYAALACERATKNAVANRAGELAAICEHEGKVRERAKKCGGAQPTDVGEAPIKQVRASIATAVQAQGTETFSPGAAATSGTPSSWTNPATKTVWSSANLAWIASLFPGRVEAPTPPSRVESIFGDTSPPQADPAKEEKPGPIVPPLPPPPPPETKPKPKK